MDKQPEAQAETAECRTVCPEDEQATEDSAESETEHQTETAGSGDQSPNPGSPEPEFQLRRSQRERRPKETLVYDTLGQPSHRVVKLHSNLAYVNALGTLKGQYSGPWLTPFVWGSPVMYPGPVAVGYY